MCSSLSSLGSECTFKKIHDLVKACRRWLGCNCGPEKQITQGTSVKMGTIYYSLSNGSRQQRQEMIVERLVQWDMKSEPWSQTSRTRKALEERGMRNERQIHS